jgi:hypothetical protein
MFSYQENIYESLEKDPQWLLHVMRKNLCEVNHTRHFKDRMQERSVSEDEYYELCDFGRITQVKPASLNGDKYLPIKFELSLRKGPNDLVAIVATDGKEFTFLTVYK